ncbi:MAG: hypothetical protein KC572_09640 [Gammaproteobacteria bacterium]|nr:hypothetical protein [Gammaproteobacteria bacterium]
MNETVLERPAAMPQRETAPAAVTRRKDTPARGYLLLALAITYGYLLRDFGYITPESGVGYWLGIIGGSMMLFLLLYPLRKRIRILQIFGPTRFWFRLHMAFGLVGPLLILYHCNFQLGSVNSKVALYCMLLVAGSGIVGRHFYARIHRGLYGRKTSLRELQQDLAASVDKSHGLATLMPILVARINKMAEELQGCGVTQTLGIRRSIRWTFTHHFTHFSLWLTARRELKTMADNSSIVARDRDRLSRAASKFIHDYMLLVGRVAQFSFYERLFALWHILHMPIFLLLVVSALFHVLAVHMY